jgi:anthranilate phosphoribosyltransferase
VLEGERTPYRDIALFNAAAALVVAEAAADLRDGVARARRPWTPAPPGRARPPRRRLERLRQAMSDVLCPDRGL